MRVKKNTCSMAMVLMLRLVLMLMLRMRMLMLLLLMTLLMAVLRCCAAALLRCCLLLMLLMLLILRMLRRVRAKEAAVNSLCAVATCFRVVGYVPTDRVQRWTTTAESTTKARRRRLQTAPINNIFLSTTQQLSITRHNTVRRPSDVNCDNDDDDDCEGACRKSVSVVCCECNEDNTTRRADVCS